MPPQDGSNAPTTPSTSRGERRFRSLRLVIGLLLPVLVLAGLTYGLLADSPRATIDEALAQSEAVEAPGFELPILGEGALGPRLSRALRPALADRRLDLEEVRGRPVVLNFWASWCDPCRKEAPLLERTWRDARDRGVVFVGLNQQDLVGDARRFLREFGTSYPNVRDPGNEVARRWGLGGLPETFFLDADGKVVAHILGEASAAELRDGIEAARSGRPVRVDRDGAGSAFELKPVE